MVILIIHRSSREYLRSLQTFRSYCKKYIWDLPEWLRKDLSLFCLKLDKEILDEKVRIRNYIEKENKNQMNIFDYEVSNHGRD